MRVLVVLVTTVLLTGAFASASPASTPDTKAMVLKLSDLPAGFVLDKGHYADNARAAKESETALADFTRWGRITGYEADFSREALTGILKVTSASSTYKTAKGAADSTRDSYAQTTKPHRFNGQPVTFKQVSTGAKIGHEARMYSTSLKANGFNFTFYAILWRYGTVKASLLVGGLRGTFDAATAVKMAKRQQARMVEALR